MLRCTVLAARTWCIDLSGDGAKARQVRSRISMVRGEDVREVYITTRVVS